MENLCITYSQLSIKHFLSICGFAYTDSTNFRQCSTAVYTVEKNPHISVPMQFKPVLFKSLFILLCEYTINYIPIMQLMDISTASIIFWTMFLILAYKHTFDNLFRYIAHSGTAGLVEFKHVKFSWVTENCFQKWLYWFISNSYCSTSLYILISSNFSILINLENAFNFHTK